MSSFFGENIKISIFGQSHSEGMGVVIDGIPAGKKIDLEKLNKFMKRRAPGQGPHTTPRVEKDKIEFLSGIIGGITCGAPISGIIPNENKIEKDYENIKNSPRPGHADFVAHIKYKGFEDYRGGGHFSGRLTAPLCIAGGICIGLLEEKNIEITTEILEIGGKTSDFLNTIKEAKANGDSVGGVVRCTVKGMPVGVGEPMFNGLEGQISKAIFAIPGIKGIEFGSGFKGSRMFGSENNDEFIVDKDIIKTKTNNHGGILGGISSGMDIVFNVAIKPTPSIGKLQDTVNYNKDEIKLKIEGRHDPSIVYRALPCIEGATAIALYDLICGDE
ncbi:MAG: chorismate synthase [Anaerovoracaceae bacterium]